MITMGRNVELKDCNGNVLAGFFQYGSVSWRTFYAWLRVLILTCEPWSIYNDDRHAAVEYLSSDAIVLPGTYFLLSADRRPLCAVLTSMHARRRQPTPPRLSPQEESFRNRVRARDGRCMIFGQQSAPWSRLQAAHIFPRAHYVEWNRKGYPALITDAALEAQIGGPSKIGSVQNAVLLRSDLHWAWDEYEFGVDPDDGYRVTAFVGGLGDVNGRMLKLDHITDATLRPPDELFRDHFLQGLLRHVRGVGERGWDYSETFGEGAFDLSQLGVWAPRKGRSG
ncbi:hypothetical protein A0H81_01947 [Grifola frondosa]|uniref:HNH nuclease domain-containing protein n=1 Tax=Grifola frondosa TaxID=5627 RepID=A0A1C7MMR3_GRIFR|nr:hypothetical protein A0H81_01947 [Grifola frondosa]